jgi:sugar lactone lactonase YvrE
MTPQVILEARAGIGESPVWHAARRTLLWVDIPARKIHSYDPANRSTRSWSVPEEVGCVAPMSDGALIIALKSSFQRLDPGDGSLARLWSTDEEPQGNRFNDGKTDRQGRFWCGSMDAAEEQPTGGLYRLDSSLECERLVSGIICSNALCWSPDGRVMYYGDSNNHVVWAWDFDVTSGGIANRRVFLEIPASEGVPDGATVRHRVTGRQGAPTPGQHRGLGRRRHRATNLFRGAAGADGCGLCCRRPSRSGTCERHVADHRQPHQDAGGRGCPR